MRSPMWLQQKPSKLLREGALELEEPCREVSKGRGGQAFVLWHLMRAASGEQSLRSLQPEAAPGGQGRTVSPSAGNSLDSWGKESGLILKGNLEDIP